MNNRDRLHLACLLPILLGFLVTIFLFTKANDYQIEGQTMSSVTLVPGTWQKVIEVIPQSMPVDVFEPAEDKVDIVLFSETNAFIISTTLMMFLGILGVGLVGAAKSIGESRFNPILRTLAVAGIAIMLVAVYGFNLAYPSGFNGFLGMPFITDFTSPAVSPKDYGMGGMTMFTDMFYFAAYICFLGALIITPTAAKQTTTSAFVIALPIIGFTGPVMVSWLWGGGWLESNFGAGITHDFAGACLFHWHVGVLVLMIAIFMRMFRQPNFQQPPENQIASAKPIWALWIPGILLYSLLLFGMNVGSTLTSEPKFVASVLQATIYSALTSMLVATIIGIFLNTRNFIEWAGLGFIAGAVVVSAHTDLVNANFALGLGVISGLVSTLAVYFVDRFIGADPLGVFGVHGVSGMIGLLAIPLNDEMVGPVRQIVALLFVPIISLVIVALLLIVFGLFRILLVDQTKFRFPDGQPELPKRRKAQF